MSGAPVKKSTSTLTPEEAALYDRQLRLWGVDAQQRLRESRVLLFGFTATMGEVCKNLVLSGVNTVTIADTQVCSARDLGSHLFLDESSLGKNRALASKARVSLLNPHVKLVFSDSPIESVDYSLYDVVVLSGQSFSTSIKVNQRARETNTLFFIVDSFGYFGYTFQDLGDNFSYTAKSPEGESVAGSLTYVSLENAMQGKSGRRTHVLYPTLQVVYEYEKRYNAGPDQENLDQFLATKADLAEASKTRGFTDEFLTMVAQSWGTELAPVCAIVGGTGAQEILKVMCANDIPFSNFFFYDGLGGGGSVVLMSS
eukprot:TRINITY_DN7056_c0_g1_i1.p1 TRINITY_DN7056_c0_g1~~TRINITY_DN7056_c0_g1_i1.p1  ORF type:complete len:313 (+),score=73.16 TRINITY_DN7056_c0_g1_i1:30-968(+)